MIALNAYKITSIVLVIGLISASGAAVYYYRQQGNQQVTIQGDANLQDSYKAQIADLTSQISKLNDQISQLQSLNNQLGGNNAQLISQIQQLQSQVYQYQIQVDGLKTQLANLNALLKLQNSRVIASQVSIWGSGSPLTSSMAFISLGSITYSGYLRVSWTGAHASFSAQVFDINITTPVVTSGIYSIPVSANATGNSWFTNFDCGLTPGGNILCGSLTYSITYWY